MTYIDGYEKLPPRRRTVLDRLLGRSRLCEPCGGRGWFPGPGEFAAINCPRCGGRGWLR